MRGTTRGLIVLLALMGLMPEANADPVGGAALGASAGLATAASQGCLWAPARRNLESCIRLERSCKTPTVARRSAAGWLDADVYDVRVVARQSLAHSPGDAGNGINDSVMGWFLWPVGAWRGGIGAPECCSQETSRKALPLIAAASQPSSQRGSGSGVPEPAAIALLALVSLRLVRFGGR